MTQLAQPTKHLSRAEDIFSYPGELISFGQSDSYSEIRGDIPITRNITFILNAIQFVTSGNHSFILTEQNHVYAFGSNTQKQLGTGATKQSNTPQIVEYLLPVKIIKIAVGAYHSLFLSQEGQVYVCGADPSTIIGGRLDNATFLPLPTILVLPAPAIDIHSGMFHCFAQLSTNRVMAWGSNQFGERGVGSRMTRAKPEEVVVFRDAPSLEISVGASHTLALLDKFLYSFGVDDCGQLGQGYTDGIATPIPVKFFKGVKMLSISAGFRHSSCITEKHEVYAWGSSKTAQVHTQSAIKYTIMKMLPGLEGVKALKLFGGFTSSYTFVQAEHGEIYSFGDNGYLNCGVIGSAAIPKRVSFLQSKRSFAIILDRVKTFILSLEAEPVMNINNTMLFDDVSIKTLQ